MNAQNSQRCCHVFALPCVGGSSHAFASVYHLFSKRVLNIIQPACPTMMHQILKCNLRCYGCIKEERHTGSWDAVECRALYLHVLLSQLCSFAQHLLNRMKLASGPSKRHHILTLVRPILLVEFVECGITHSAKRRYLAFK